jgi:hypothetical protein
MFDNEGEIRLVMHLYGRAVTRPYERNHAIHGIRP